MENDEKPYGLSFESAGIYAESLGIQIKDYELVPIMISYSIGGEVGAQYKRVIETEKMIRLYITKNPNQLSHHALLTDTLAEIAKRENIDYLCSIKIFGVNNLNLEPGALEKSFWMNVLSATGLRLKPKPKIKTEPPPLITLPNKEA